MLTLEGGYHMPHRSGVILFLSGVLSLLISASVFAASVNLPQTGQKKCYDSTGTERTCAGTGEDGEIRAGAAWPDARFTVSGDCVTDNLTGLMWTKDANIAFGKVAWETALSAIDLCGYTDWRLPNVNELESLFHAGINEDTCGGSSLCSSVAAWLNYMGFINVQSASAWYWTSTTYQKDAPIYAWAIDLQFGGINDGGHKLTAPKYAWMVRTNQTTNVPANLWRTGQTTSYATGDDVYYGKGIAWPSPRFTVSGDCVTDNLTGLMWAKDANIFGSVTWQTALEDAYGLTLCDYSDWRLPNRKELYSLIDHSQIAPALPSGHPFDNVVSISGKYWSSTTYDYYLSSLSNYRNNAWYVEMYYGRVDYGDKTDTILSHYVWPVRGGILSCTNTPIKISGRSINYATVQEAYDEVTAVKTIMMPEYVFTEALSFSGSKTVSLEGGYDCGFAAQSGYTTIYGSLTIAGTGGVAVDRMIIK
jgi:hypothetical protein